MVLLLVVIVSPGFSHHVLLGPSCCCRHESEICLLDQNLIVFIGLGVLARAVLIIFVVDGTDVMSGDDPGSDGTGNAASEAVIEAAAAVGVAAAAAAPEPVHPPDVEVIGKFVLKEGGE